jgi:hypothetical protein
MHETWSNNFAGNVASAKLAEKTLARVSSFTSRAPCPVGFSAPALLRPSLRRKETSFFDPFRGPEGPLFHPNTAPALCHLLANPKKNGVTLKFW